MVRGGNHGGNGVKIFGYENINANDPFMEIFLWDQMIHYHSHQQNNSSVFPYSSGSHYEYKWPNTQESRFVIDHGVLPNEEPLMWTNFNQTSTLCLKDIHGYEKNTKIVRRKIKKETSIISIKGQWTKEEDRYNITKNTIFFQFIFIYK